MAVVLVTFKKFQKISLHQKIRHELSGGSRWGRIEDPRSTTQLFKYSPLTLTSDLEPMPLKSLVRGLTPSQDDLEVLLPPLPWLKVSFILRDQVVHGRWVINLVDKVSSLNY